MKGNKLFLVAALLLFFAAVSFSTYAIYKSSATGSKTVNAAAWVVEVNDTDIVANNTFTMNDITWNTTNRVGQAGTIAPGDTGTVTLTIDADGSQVAVAYNVSIDTSALSNPNFSVTAASGSSLTGTIAYSATEGQMERTITLNVVWNGVDSETANTADLALEGTQISIPVVVTVTQSPNPAA